MNWRLFRVKHLNPRQGITTHLRNARLIILSDADVCETPKSPPGDYNATGCFARYRADPLARVKHLNPRQGITTSDRAR